MLILKKRGTTRIELSPAGPEQPAVAVHVTPIGQADIDVAMAAVSSAIVKAEESESLLIRYGLAGGETAADTMRMALRVGSAMLAIELGIRHITAWEGVGTEEGEPAPVEPALIALLFNEWAPAGLWSPTGDADPRESYAARFTRRINGLSTLEPGAKKGSAAVPAGGGAAAETSAGAAG